MRARRQTVARQRFSQAKKCLAFDKIGNARDAWQREIERVKRGAVRGRLFGPDEGLRQIGNLTEN
jgi:hypothetical protein